MDVTTLQKTRRSLHGIAELVLAGPLFRGSGELRLRVTPGGFGVWDGEGLRVSGVSLVGPHGSWPLDGRTYADLAAAAGVAASPLDDVYSDGPHVPVDEVISVDRGAVEHLEAAFALGDAALDLFAPETERVLWPEHFDVALTLDEVNYGISPGDGYLDEPYAYVGPPTARSGDFWNAPFGAVRPLRDVPNTTHLVEFFREGRVQASG